MDSFDTIDKVYNLFKNVNCIGNDNCFFIAYKDMPKKNGMVNGMEYPYDALLINENEYGIGFFYLKQPGLVLTQNISKMNIDINSFIFISNQNITEIKVKNYAIFNKKTKRITIDTNLGKKHELFSKLNEKMISYQTENLMKFINKHIK